MTIMKLRVLALAILASITTACGSGLISHGGPSERAINKAPQSEALGGINVIDLDRGIATQMASLRKDFTFADTMGGARPVGSVVRPGDVLEVSIWEAPPAALFGGAGTSSVMTRAAGIPDVSTTSTLPELLVGLSGRVFIPFAGEISVSGRSTRQIEAEITSRLSGKAHLPQVIVRIARNATANVTVVGEVSNSTRMALTPKGERLLDALAQAGGTSQPPSKMTVQITRGDRVVAMPLESVIRDPHQNVILETGDVVTAIYQPYTFVVLGAAGRNDEVKFESNGVSLAQAFGRIGGLQGDRANAKGLFIFRWEQPANLPVANGVSSVATAAQDGRVPVIYRVNMMDPATYFLAQQFPMRNGDIVYVANAPITEFQQFVNVIASTVLPLVAVKNSVN